MYPLFDRLIIYYIHRTDCVLLLFQFELNAHRLNVFIYSFIEAIAVKYILTGLQKKSVDFY